MILYLGNLREFTHTHTKTDTTNNWIYQNHKIQNQYTKINYISMFNNRQFLQGN